MLRQEQANGLIVPLKSAIRSLVSGKIDSALSQMQDLIDEVNQKVLDGVLPPDEGAALIAAVGNILDQLGC